MYKLLCTQKFNCQYRFSTLTDSELDAHVCDVKQNMPDVGERMLQGALYSKGVIVPRRRLREAIHRVDPINVALRWQPRIQRRCYSVPGPNSLWHIGKCIHTNTEY